MREIVLDTETTGLDPKQGHRIIEVGALEIYNKVPTGKVFHYYINPERHVPNEAFQIHGISTAYLQDKKKFVDIADEFLAFIQDSKLVIHNASFDMGFLNFELNLIARPTIDFAQAIDTLQMARRQFPGQRNNLDALCRRFNIDNAHRKYHGALKDAELLVEIYVELTGGRQTKLEVTKKEKVEAKSDRQVQYTKLDFKIVTPTNEELTEYNALQASLSSKGHF